MINIFQYTGEVLSFTNIITKVLSHFIFHRYINKGLFDNYIKSSKEHLFGDADSYTYKISFYTKVVASSENCSNYISLYIINTRNALKLHLNCLFDVTHGMNTKHASTSYNTKHPTFTFILRASQIGNLQTVC